MVQGPDSKYRSHAIYCVAQLTMVTELDTYNETFNTAPNKWLQLNYKYEFLVLLQILKHKQQTMQRMMISEMFLWGYLQHPR